MDEQEIKHFLEKLFDKHEETQKDVGEIKVILARQEVQIAEHIKRTNLAEENIDLLRGEFKPIQSKIDNFIGGLKLLGIISMLAGIVVGILKVI